MIHKGIISILICGILCSCGSLGWWAGKSVLPVKKNPVKIETHVGDNSYAKNNVGEVAGRDITEVKEARQVLITTVPWPVIWLLMIGWPLALIGWMIDPPCEIYRRYTLRHRHKSHVEP